MSADEVDDLDEAGPWLVRRGGFAVRKYWQERLQREERILRCATRGPGRTDALARRDRARRLTAVLSSRGTIGTPEQSPR